MRCRRLVAAPALVALLLGGCAAPTPAASEVSAGGERPTITIAAAASLGDALQRIADRFEHENPSVDVRPIVIDGSSTLARQIEAGAPFDVFVSADEATMASVSGLVEEPVPIATSTLVIVVPAGNPGGVDAIDDLATVSTVLCAPEVPCGSASQRLLALSGVDARPVTLAQSVRGVLAQVETNAVDAGLVYATDAAASESVETIEVAGAEHVVNRAVIAAVRASPEPALAAALVEYVAGRPGRAVLDELGFGAP